MSHTVTEVAEANRVEALVLVNSFSPLHSDFERYIQPYLDHFGVPYRLHDLAHSAVPADVHRYALLIIGHGELDVTEAHLDGMGQQRLVAAVSKGTGLVIFDGALATASGQPIYRYVQDMLDLRYSPSPPAVVRSIEVLSGGRAAVITDNHDAAGSLPLSYGMAVPTIRPPDYVDVLATAEGQPLLMGATFGQGRVVHWTTYAWAHTSIRGPLFGLDDLVWRALVWAARKPFVMQAMVPFVTMRVDDVCGHGLRTGSSPWWWLKTANLYGLKPWLGLDIWDMSLQASEELRPYVFEGSATASVHSFTGHNFLYFDHWNSRPFSDTVLAEHFSQVRAWYGRQGALPVSRLVIGHFYEVGANALEELRSWGVEFLGTPVEVGAPYNQRAGTPWVAGGPYRKHEDRRLAFDQAGPGGPWRGDEPGCPLPFYYADFLSVPDLPSCDGWFFNVLTEIRDTTGYEWFPDQDVKGTVERGVKQLRRALDSLALATLFTHEGCILRADPGVWKVALSEIAAAVTDYDPEYVTLDEACRYVRALHTSRFEAAVWDPQACTLTVRLTGRADVRTRLAVYVDDELSPLWVDVPVFEDRVTVAYVLS